MPTTLNFAHADAIVTHFAALVSPTLDPLIAVKYAGFVSVAAVCAYEMAIKDIFMNFAAKKHPVLGSMARETFERINGRANTKLSKTNTFLYSDQNIQQSFQTPFRGGRENS